MQSVWGLAIVSVDWEDDDIRLIRHDVSQTMDLIGMTYGHVTGRCPGTAYIENKSPTLLLSNVSQ